MKTVFGHPSLYLAIPFYVATLAVFGIFNVPQGYIPWLMLFPVMASLGVFVDLLLMSYARSSPALLPMAAREIGEGKNHAVNQLALLLGVTILFFCFVDLSVNGLMILKASQYTELLPAGMHVRHISNMCWILVPISYFCVSSPWLRRGFVLSAIIFPILFVDRNRLIQSMFCVIWLNLCLSGKARLLSIKVVGIVFVLLSVFAAIGFARSGTETFLVPSSGYLLLENQFPLQDWFLKTPVFVQQILLYISSPVFNLATIAVSGYKDPTILFSQLLSFLGYSPSINTPPVLVPRFNVGTEFFPFFLFGGAFPSALAFLGIFLAVVIAHVMLVRRPNIFYLLLYLRVAYCCFMSGFAPQFYTWTNIDFLLMCLFDIKCMRAPGTTDPDLVAQITGIPL